MKIELGEEKIEEELFQYIKEIGEIDFKETVKNEDKIKLIKNAIAPSPKEKRRIRIVSNIMLKQANNIFYSLQESEQRKKGLFKKKIETIKEKIDETLEDTKQYRPSKPERAVFGFLSRLGFIISTSFLLFRLLRPTLKNVDVVELMRDKFFIPEKYDFSVNSFKTYLQQNTNNEFQKRMRQIFYALRKLLEYFNDVFTFEGTDYYVKLENHFSDVSKHIYNEFGDIVPVDYLEYRMQKVVEKIVQKAANDKDEATKIALENFSMFKILTHSINSSSTMSDEEIDEAIMELLNQKELFEALWGLVDAHSGSRFESRLAINKALTDLRLIGNSTFNMELENFYRENFYNREELEALDIVDEKSDLLQKNTNTDFLYNILMDGEDFIIPFFRFPSINLGKELIFDFFCARLSQQFEIFSKDKNQNRIKTNINAITLIPKEKKEKFVTLEETIDTEFLDYAKINVILPPQFIDGATLKRTWADNDSDILDKCIEAMDETKVLIMDIFKKEKDKKLKRVVINESASS